MTSNQNYLYMGTYSSNTTTPSLAGRQEEYVAFETFHHSRSSSLYQHFCRTGKR